jgi:hypothetical protein
LGGTFLPFIYFGNPVSTFQVVGGVLLLVSVALLVALEFTMTGQVYKPSTGFPAALDS